jgi:hypothetical protein
MGMYDREPLFGEEFNVGDRFVVTDARYVGKIKTTYGEAEKSIFTIVSRKEPKKKISYSVLGEGFARQARQAERGDFPHVAEYVKIPTGTGGNEVKLLVKVDVQPRAFIDGDDGPELDTTDLEMRAGAASGVAAGEDDIPF